METAKCPSCFGTSWTFIQSLKEYKIERCKGCKLLRSIGTPRNGTGEDEFGHLDLDSYFKSLEPIRVESANSLLDQIEKRVKPGKLLDIGCSFGWFLDVAQNRGWKTYGIEPSTVAFNYIENKKRHAVKKGVFPSSSFDDVTFDVVVMTDVLEHLPDPVQTLREVQLLLGDEGVLALRVPNQQGLIFKMASLLAKATGSTITGPAWRMWQLDFPYPHLWYFSPGALKNVVENANYEVSIVDTEPAIKLGAVGTRVKYLSTTNKWMSFAMTAGLAACAAAAQVSGMHDECYVIAKTNAK